jgi:hypothetical protein
VTEEIKTETNSFSWAVPEELHIPEDKLRVRLDFYHQAIEMTDYSGEQIYTKVISARDISLALASEITFSSGLLPKNTLWWANNRQGPLWAIYEEPKVRILTVQKSIKNRPQRYKIPLPGFIILCRPGQSPWIYAVKSRPESIEQEVFKAPLLNIYNTGKTCAGSQKYSQSVDDIVEEFFVSYFSVEANVSGRSEKYPRNVYQLWKDLKGKTEYPLEDLVYHGTVSDLMTMVI